MQDNFAFFFKRVLEDEGVGYEDVPGDNGGPTKCGITIADVARYNGVHCPDRGGPGWDALVAKVHALDPAQAGIIYKKFYWDEVRADDLLSGLDYSVADYAVNSGTGRAVPVLRHIVGLAAGNKVDDDLLHAIRNGGDVRDIINRYQDERRAFLEHIAQVPHNAKFRTGWLNRETRVRKIALNLAGNAAKATEVIESPKAVGDHPNDAVMGVVAGAEIGAVEAASSSTPVENDPKPAAEKVTMRERARVLQETIDLGSHLGTSIRSGVRAIYTMLFGTAAVGGTAATLLDPNQGTAHVATKALSPYPVIFVALFALMLGVAIAGGIAWWFFRGSANGLVTAFRNLRYLPPKQPTTATVSGTVADVSRETVPATQGA